MKWQKLGQVFQPSGKIPWARSHGANPVAEHLEGEIFRIYFSTRDEKNRSSIGSVEINLKNPGRVLAEAADPVLTFGEIGMPDDCGVSIGCIIAVGHRRHLYYMGWNLAVTVPWKNTIGLALSEANESSFTRYSRFPIVSLDEIDPYTISYPWIIKDGPVFRMWYGSNLQWGPEKRDMLHVIKYAESHDGIHWDKKNIIAINSRHAAEYAICRPCVVRDPDRYRMWYCYRGESYRIGYAESDDGIRWERNDHLAGIDVSETGWDSQTIEYPSVFDHVGERYLLYSGNDFGKTGFGLARLVEG